MYFSGLFPLQHFTKHSVKENSNKTSHCIYHKVIYVHNAGFENKLCCLN